MFCARGSFFKRHARAVERNRMFKGYVNKYGFKVIFLILFIFLVSCRSEQSPKQFFQPHIGEWSGIDSKGSKAIILFRENGTGYISFDKELYRFNYVFDYSKNPVWLDLISSRKGRPFRAKLIVRFMGKNRFKFRTFFNEKRPSEFLEDDLKNTVFLTKITPKRKT